MFFLKNSLQINILYLKNFLFIFLFICPVYFWGIQIYKIDIRFLIIFLIFPILYKFNFKQNDISLLIIGTVLFIHKLPYINNDEIFYNLILFLYLIILAKILKVFYKFFLNTIDNQINIFLIIFIISSFLITFYYYYFFNVITSHCVIGCFSTYKILYLENSHLGMMASSLILYCLYKVSISKNKINFILLLTFFLICMFNYSLTFYAGLIFNSILLLLIFWKKINNKYLTYLIIVLLISFLSIANNKIHLVKIASIIHPVKIYLENIIYNKNFNNISDLRNNNLNDKIKLNKNLSSDVYLKGIKIMIKSIYNYPFGVGLNNYEFSHNKFIKDIDVDFNITKELNIKDASFNFVKIISEFGVLSLIFFYLIVRFIFSKKIDLQYKIFLLPNVISQLIFRGAGYFNGGFIMFVIVMILLVLQKDKTSKNF